MRVVTRYVQLAGRIALHLVFRLHGYLELDAQAGVHAPFFFLAETRLVHGHQGDIEQESGLFLFQVLQAGTQFELARMPGEIVVVDHVAQFHVLVVRHITFQLAYGGITGDTYPRCEAPVRVEEVAVTDIDLVAQLAVTVAFFLETFNLVIQVVTEGRGAHPARNGEVGSLPFRGVLLRLAVLTRLLAAVAVLAAFAAARSLLRGNGRYKAAGSQR